MSTTNMMQTDAQHGTPLAAIRASSQAPLPVPNPIMPSSAPETTELSSIPLTLPDPMTSMPHTSSRLANTLPSESTHPILSSNPVDPQITLTFLLLSGRRRTLAFPENTTVSRVKEIIWNSWPSESQDEQPPTPGFLRLLHLGKIWMDDTRLVDMNLTGTPQFPTVVHLSIRPFLSPDDEGMSSAAKKRKAKRTSTMASDAQGAVAERTHESGAAEAHNGCCCIIC